jgi:hypothetical protein
MKSDKKLTLREVKESGIKKWKWLWEHPEMGSGTRVVAEIPFYESELAHYNDDGCSACRYNRDHEGVHCSECPIMAGIGRCNIEEGNVFDSWCYADNPTDRAYFAKKIYEAHEAIEVPHMFKVGDRVRDTKDSQGDTAIVTELLSDNKIGVKWENHFSFGSWPESHFELCDTEKATEIEVGDTVKTKLGIQGKLLFIGSEEGKLLTPLAYLSIDGAKIHTCRVENITFVSRPEKPVEHVFKGIKFIKVEKPCEYLIPFGDKFQGEGEVYSRIVNGIPHGKRYDMILRERNEDTKN